MVETRWSHQGYDDDCNNMAIVIATMRLLQQHLGPSYFDTFHGIEAVESTFCGPGSELSCKQGRMMGYSNGLAKR